MLYSACKSTGKSFKIMICLLFFSCTLSLISAQTIRKQKVYSNSDQFQSRTSEKAKNNQLTKSNTGLLTRSSVKKTVSNPSNTTEEKIFYAMNRKLQFLMLKSNPTSNDLEEIRMLKSQIGDWIEKDQIKGCSGQ